jgi:hypothetical protein
LGTTDLSKRDPDHLIPNQAVAGLPTSRFLALDQRKTGEYMVGCVDPNGIL